LNTKYLSIYCSVILDSPWVFEETDETQEKSRISCGGYLQLCYHRQGTYHRGGSLRIRDTLIT